LSLPEAVLDRAGAENVGVPEPMEGWTWVTLDGFIDSDELDGLAAIASKHADAPALALSIHDSDTVYVVGADPSGVRFRLVVNPEAWEDELPPQDLEAAAAWSREHANLDPSSEEIAAVLARQFVFAEEGLDVLLALMGLLPAEAAEGTEELGMGVAANADVWSWLEAVRSPQTRILERGRWHTSLQHGDVAGHLLAAEEDTKRLMIDARVDPLVMSEVPDQAVSGFVIRPGEPIVFLGQVSTREDLWNDLTRQGVTLGQWAEVPETVPRDLGSAAAWLLSG
jgi:hypothetical protein